MRNENFYVGFVKKADMLTAAGGALLGAAKGVGSWIMKNKMTTLSGVLTADQLAGGARAGANMAAKATKDLSVPHIQY